MKKFIILAAVALMAAGCKDHDDDWKGGSVIPVSLKGIEAVNVDNSGEFPFVSTSPVKKEAYMLGIKWKADNLPTEDDRFVTGSSQGWYYGYNPFTRYYSKTIICLTQFNADIPAGGNVSKFFKEINPSYLPAGIDEGFVLLVAPDPGEHSFRVEYYEDDELKFYYETPTVELF